MNAWVALAVGLAAGTLAAGALHGLRSASERRDDQVYRILPPEAFLLDPSAGAWAPAGAPSTLREGHHALLLPDGKILLVGGTDANSHDVPQAELFDPAKKTFSPAGDWPSPDSAAHPVVLQGGDVILFALDREKDSVRWTPPASWSRVSTPPERRIQAAARLPDGRILIVDPEESWVGDGRGAWQEAGKLRFNATPALALLPTAGGALLLPYLVSEKPEDPENTWYPSHLWWNEQSRTWAEDGPLAAALRALNPRSVQLDAAFLLQDGRIAILARGAGLLWDPVAKKGQPLPDLPVSDTLELSFERLADDRILLGGGPGAGAAECFILDAKKGTWSPAPPLPQPRSRFRLTCLEDGRVLATGGGSMGVRSTGARGAGVFMGVLGGVVLLASGLIVARSHGTGYRWLGYGVGMGIPPAILAATYWIQSLIAGAIKG